MFLTEDSCSMRNLAESFFNMKNSHEISMPNTDEIQFRVTYSISPEKILRIFFASDKLLHQKNWRAEVSENSLAMISTVLAMYNCWKSLKNANSVMINSNQIFIAKISAEKCCFRAYFCSERMTICSHIFRVFWYFQFSSTEVQNSDFQLTDRKKTENPKPQS